MQLHATTTAGDVRGRERRGVALFAGIPYAAPPVGERRFAPPQPADGWSGVRDATRFGPAAPQLPGEGLTSAMAVAWDEDCLTLNVCTPAADDGGRPVMVWIHGGAFRHGTGATPWYDGTRFAAEGDVVVVTINYRLGALGFARLDDAPTSGVNGILDQVAALEWVRDNIAAFGGDPGNVTIAGESAGAFSVTTLLTLPAAQGLFHRAIAQSGAGHHVLATDAAREAARRLADHAAAPDLDALRAAPVADILRAQQKVEVEAPSFLSPWDMAFSPSVTPEVLPARPIDLLGDGVAAHIPVLTGTNTDEMALWGVGAMPADKLHDMLRGYVDDPTRLVEGILADQPEAGPGQIALAASTDYTFRIPAIRMAEARARHGGITYMYEFDWKSRAFGGALGSCHALEIPFAFGTLDRPGVGIFLGTDDLPHDLGDVMHATWRSFIRTGDPEGGGVDNWPPYRPENRAVVRFADDVTVVHDPWPAARESWHGHR